MSSCQGTRIFSRPSSSTRGLFLPLRCLFLLPTWFCPKILCSNCSTFRLHLSMWRDRGNRSRGHHRLLVPGRRFAQAEHRHGHPDRLRPRRARNAPAARCACREAVRLGERSELRSSRKAPRRQVPRRATRGALRSKVTRGCAVSNKIESLVAEGKLTPSQAIRLHALAQLAYEGIMDDLAAGGGAATDAAPTDAKG